MFERQLADAGELLRGLEAPGVAEEERGRFHGDALGERRMPFRHHAATQVDQDFRNVDLHRTNFIACAAERRRIGQRARVLHVLELWRKDRADRSGVNRAVCVAAGLAVHRAGVQARAAADALQRLARSLSASTLVRPLSSSTTWNWRGPS